MTTAKQLADYAQAAQAAYAHDLTPNVSNADKYRDKPGMSASQAEQFDSEWTVLEQSAPALNGFSAVLLQNAATGEKVLAIAGTDGLADIWADYKYILQANNVFGMGQFQSLEAFYQQLIADNKLTATEQVVVTGHSLGGFLAQAFTATHASVVRGGLAFSDRGISGFRAGHYRRYEIHEEAQT